LALTRRGKALSALVILVALSVIVLAGGWFYLRSLGVFGSSDPGRSVAVVIPRGSSASDVAKLLEEKKVIPSALGFRIYLKIHGETPTIQAGTYDLHEGLDVKDALAALDRQRPHARFVTVTFPEGSWLTDFARILSRDTHISGRAFLRAARSDKVRSKLEPPGVHNLEGLLFPSTYQIVSRDTALSVLHRLVDQFDAQVSKLDLSEIRAKGYTPYQAITVASMVEAEAKVDKDRPKIAEVIYNRLHQGIRLGIDATIDYALGHHVAELTQSDLAIDSPYNTRLRTGLPPTPIGAAGMASLEAAAAPATGHLLYYVVADCRGHHFFTADYGAFLRAKARYKALAC
jgi:peptidoglycan lytic transglycosylase G